VNDPSASWPALPGEELGGFELEAVAGRGGMGVVYLARQHNPERKVALKVIAPELADDPKFADRFRRESGIAAQLEHPNVIPVYATGDQDGTLYLAMRFVDGTDLRHVIAEEGKLEPTRAARIVDQVAQALDAAHRQGLVHRDVKPANILIATVGEREHVYLTDFGLTRRAESTTGLTVTQTGVFLGTPDYVAPEQARGERVDARADVYSLGCVLFQALTATVPFAGRNNLAKLYAHATEPPPRVLDRAPAVPEAFDVVLARAMAKAPDDRYPSAGDLGRAALAAASGISVSRAERSVASGDAAPPPTIGRGLAATKPPAPRPERSETGTIGRGLAATKPPSQPRPTGGRETGKDDDGVRDLGSA
jgi:serine/threonine protein kinase